MNTLYKTFAFILLITTALCAVDQDAYTSNSQTSSSNSILDIAYLEAKCPNNGAMKSFKILYDSGSVKYSYVCYSAKTAKTEYDESVLKDLLISKTTSTVSCNSNIGSISGLTVKCPVDYAINSFQLVTDSSKTQCSFSYNCVGIKPKLVGILKGSSDKVTSDVSKLSSLSDLNCGSTSLESESETGFPLNWFKVESDSSSYFQYSYGYQKLRDIKSFKDGTLESTAALRNNNDQKN